MDRGGERNKGVARWLLSRHAGGLIRASILALVLVACAPLPARADVAGAALQQSIGDKLAAVDETVHFMSLPGIGVRVVYEECGVENAAYLPPEKALLVCLEILNEDTEVVRSVIAHEMAHAIIGQYELPVPGSEEEAADELAAVAMGMSGHSAATVAMASFYATHDDGGEDVEDDHQSNAKRAATLICLGDGSTEAAVQPMCRLRYLKAQYIWSRLLTTFGPPELRR